MGNAVSQIVDPPRVHRSEVRAKLEEAQRIGAIVAGVGLTGLSACRLFTAAGIPLSAADEKQPAKHTREELERFGIPIWTENHIGRGVKGLSGAAFALFSPGVPPGGELASFVFEKGIPSLAELDLLGECAGDPWVAVTGTNGKSTTTMLIFEMLRASGQPVELIGNIGTPFVELLTVKEIFEEVPHFRRFVAELSSYQLEWASECRPKVAVWLNLAENHLERHLTMDRYLFEKRKILTAQSEHDFAILNADDPYYEEFRSAVRGRCIPFGMTAEGSGAARLVNEHTLEIEFEGEDLIFDLGRTPLLGLHNRMNLAAAVTASLYAGGTAEGIISAIDRFSGLEHRLEAVRDTPLVINDSKATTPHAAANDLRAVLSNFPGRPVTLLVGGLAKIGSWDVLAGELSSQIRRVIGFGKNGADIIGWLGGGALSAELDSVPTLADAVELTLGSLQPDEILLFAPGCPSFDAYSGFEERGRHFKKLVREMLE